MSKKRHWNDAYVRYGFTVKTENDDIQCPQCILCSATFSNACLKPSKLDEHFQRKHGGEKAGYDLEALKVKKARFDRGGTLPKLGFVAVDRPFLLASYRVAYQVAKSKKPHTVAEELIKPCAIDMAGIVLGKEAQNKLKQVPLSNDVIRGRIVDMSQDILQQVIEDIKRSPAKISLQLDESTDVSNCSQLMTYVRYVKEKEVLEHFLFCEPLKTITKAVDVFNLVREFFAKHEVPLGVIGSVCSDGAPAMLGNRSGFAALMQKEIPAVKITHCVLHRHALAAKTLTHKLKETLASCVKVVNTIWGRALNHRLFKSFCEEIGNEHAVLLYHTDVRWPSRGKVLRRVFELREEIKQFFRDHGNDLAKLFEKPQFVQQLAYLADVFTHLNELNISMQGKGFNIVVASEKLTAFKEKLALWTRRVGRGNFSNFPSLDSTIDEDGVLNPAVASEITEHLQNLRNSFDGYFSLGELRHANNWIRDPFLFNLQDMDDDDQLKENLIELRSNQALRMELGEKNLPDFWASQLETFPVLAVEAVAVLVAFATTYLCETGFSTLLHVKTKFRNRLDPQHDMRVALSSKMPLFDKIIEGKQQHPSH